MPNLMKHIHFKRIITMLCISAMLLSGIFFGTPSVKADEEAYIKSGTTMLRVRDSAGGSILQDEAGNPVYLSGDTRVTVIDSTNSAWYKITFSYNGAQLEGYVSSGSCKEKSVELFPFRNQSYSYPYLRFDESHVASML